MTYLIITLIVAITAIAYAIRNYIYLKGLSEGTKEMVQIAKFIRDGANTFLRKLYAIVIPVMLAIALVLSGMLDFSVAVAFIIGTLMSAAAGIFGMQGATRANVRVAEKARSTQNIFETLKVAVLGGSINGLSTMGFALLGLVIVSILYHNQLFDISETTNSWGIGYIPISQILTAYALGCSVIAIFARVAGGIYTKGSDTAADLVGKTEEHIPEDDPRNAAVIADNVGDNVGDTAGLGSDLLESFMGTIVSTIVLLIHTIVSYLARNMEFSQKLFEKLYIFPIVFVTIGLFSCMLALFRFLKKKAPVDDEPINPHAELNKFTWTSAGLTAVLNIAFTFMLFGGENVGGLPFKFGFASLIISAVVGIVAGIAIGIITEIYTSDEKSTTKKIVEIAPKGASLVINQGMAGAMKSVLPTVIVLACIVLIPYACAGFIGIAISAVGMLSFVAATVTVDSYGPIADNAGGIAEMAKLGDDVRKITDMLDAVGNTTAAIGKGLAIGAASSTTIGMMIAYVYIFNPPTAEVSLNMINPLVFAGLLVGCAITYFFSGMLIEAVAEVAEKMVQEVRRQFAEIPGLREGEALPDYNECVEIATVGAIKEMKLPAIIAIILPIVGGFIMGPLFVGGILMGAILSAIVLAVFCGNSGGAWDNAKKLVEALGKKGYPEHIATVVGDTVGDSLKDTVGPSLDIFIKIMSTVSILFAPLFSVYNLINLISK